MAFPRIEPQPNNNNNNNSTSSPSTNLNNQVGNRRLSGGNQGRPPISKSGCATIPTSTSIQSSSTSMSNQQSSTSYYLPPPGYLVPQDSNQQRRDSISSLKTLTDSTSTSSSNPFHKSISSKSNSHPPLPSKDYIHLNAENRRRSHDDRITSNADRPYGRAGSFHVPSSPLQHVVDQFLPNFGVGTQNTEIPNHHGWRDGKGKEKQNERANHPGLSHSDWSVPQAKAILSTYATLATLLAGTTTTLLTYYRNPLEGEGVWGPVILGITQAALILNIYAALLAVGLIAVSITLQTPNHNHNGNGSKDADVMQMFNSSSFSNNRGQGQGQGQGNRQSQSRTSIEPRILSPLTVCILDRLTLGVSWLITLAGAMELLGLFMYAAHFQSFEVGISMSIGGVLCLLVTGVCVFAGWAVSGKETDRGRGRESDYGRGDYASLRMNEEFERNRNEEYERSRIRNDEYQRKRNTELEEEIEGRLNEEDQKRNKQEVEVEMKMKIQPQPLPQPQSSSQPSNRTIWAAR